MNPTNFKMSVTYPKAFLEAIIKEDGMAEEQFQEYTDIEIEDMKYDSDLENFVVIFNVFNRLDS